MSLKDARTASVGKSIWLQLSEDEFRKNLVILEERTNTMPVEPKIFSSVEWRNPSARKATYTLPLEVEQQIADDFACLAAVAEGAQSVAAVCIEEDHVNNTITLRFAALDLSLDESVKSALQDVIDVLAETASSPARGKEVTEEYVERVFDIVMRLHELRLLARLRSSKWEKPKYLSRSHKKPLWQDFVNLIHRAEFAYTKREKTAKQVVEFYIKSLATVYENFESSVNTLSALKHLVDQSLEFCSSLELKDYLQRLQNQTKQTSQIAAAIKSLRQIQKIAAYKRISTSLVTVAQAHSPLFHNIKITYLTGYHSVPTSIGHHGWAKSCHVHAEVQLAVYYDLYPQNRPRVIGISKWLCYLCYQFLSAHGQFFPSKTHGQLFDQWTIPDLEEYSNEIVHRYRSVVGVMNDVIVRQTEEEPELSRLKPMTSCTVD